MDYLKNLVSRYRVYIVIILVLAVGFFYKKKADAVKLANIRESLMDAKNEGLSNQPKTIMINSHLHGKTQDEKRKFLLNNFDMDCVAGDSKAKVTIVDFSSFDCKFCKKMRPDIKKIVHRYTVEDKTVRYALRPLFKFKNIPLGAFLQCSRYKDRLAIAEDLFDSDVNLIEDYESFTVELGKKYNMDDQYIRDCLHDKDLYEKIIYMQQSNKEVFNVNATPVLIINGQRIVGYKNYDQIKRIVENILKDKGND
ncbi:MAG: DsbA family protein [Rickettsiales bacterium]|jgi:protein-disulfide isomerase|nr:DsbA family protein [Rickettsiales bacterium]